MTSKLIRTVIVTSLLTALTVSAVAIYAAPRLMAANDGQNNGATLQPAMYNGDAQPDVYTQPPRHARLHRARPAVYNDDQQQQDTQGAAARAQKHLHALAAALFATLLRNHTKPPSETPKHHLI